jgi:hypothetical protein
MQRSAEHQREGTEKNMTHNQNSVHVVRRSESSRRTDARCVARPSGAAAPLVEVDAMIAA